jgi:DNA-binding LytR/AlgR family response regulator
MESLKAVLADDERPLRQSLRERLAEDWPELRICGEAENGFQALELIERHRPEIAFLDIKMPGMTGLEVAGRIAGFCRVVFVTAYDQYAVEAFEKEAVDYLLKPVTPELALELDPDQFWQIHRGTIINVRSVARVSRSLTGSGVVRLKNRSETLKVSCRYMHRFRQM